MIHKLPDLNFFYDDFEPYFDTKTMKIHYTKHHQTYINNLNNFLKNTKFSKYDKNSLLSKLDLIPKKNRNYVRNNLGGHINHSFFWKILKKNTFLKGKLKKYIKKYFLNFDNFKKCFIQSAMGHFGSGWVWLVQWKKKLFITNTSNQDNPRMSKNFVKNSGFPILGLDLWEHSYYLKYQNNKLEYINAYFNIINWDQASINFEKSLLLNI
ncbi:MAG: superoxide dismutase [Mn] [Buchnera aphidicola (Periphyllus acericola)]|uniref:Fe-Mn family superoxide dismutase n=1 Tax=Buchnera aphidicola TaxID=9 RepID=UPI0030CB120D|nr:superoxide dismutase [Mn] [Buchnera aphidicola (Periphyllus acericola)]